MTARTPPSTCRDGESPGGPGSSKSLPSQLGVRGILRRGAMVGGGLLAASYVTKYASQLLLARWMTGEDYGTYAYLLSWALLLAIPADLGLGTASLRLVPEYATAGDRHGLAALRRFSMRATILIGTSLAALALCIALGAAAGTGTVLALFFAAAIIPGQAVVNLQSELTRATGDIASAYGPAHVLFPALLISMAGGVWISRFALTPASALLATCGALAGTIIIQLVILRSRFPTATFAYNQACIRRWTSISLPLMLVSLSSLLLSRADVLIVGSLETAAAAGTYHAASRTAALAQFPLIAFSSIAAPMIATLHARQDKAQLKRVVKSAARWMFVVSAGVCATLVVLGLQILDLFGPEFRAAYPVLLVLCIGHLVNAACGPVGYLLSLTGAERQCLQAYATCSLLGVGAGVLLTFWLGSLGAAVGAAGALIVLNVWLVLAVRKRFGFWTLGLVFSLSEPDSEPE